MHNDPFFNSSDPTPLKTWHIADDNGDIWECKELADAAFTAKCCSMIGRGTVFADTKCGLGEIIAADNKLRQSHNEGY